MRNITISTKVVLRRGFVRSGGESVSLSGSGTYGRAFLPTVPLSEANVSLINKSIGRV